MTENREKEWQNLLTKATQMLENPHLLPTDRKNKQFNPILHLWVSPTFTPDKHWVFYTPQHQLNPQPKPIVRQIIWRKEMDYQRLNNPLIGLEEGFHTEPTFETKTVEIEKEIFDKLHNDLAKIQLPPFIKDEILGLDGEHFGVETLGFYHNAKITWWSTFPEEWKELVDWYKGVKGFLDKHFSDI
jgi:hypothetical protein